MSSEISRSLWPSEGGQRVAGRPCFIPAHYAQARNRPPAGRTGSVAGQGRRPARDGVAPAVSARFSGVPAPGGTLTGMSIATIRVFVGATAAGASLVLAGATVAATVAPAAAAVASPVLGHWAPAAPV